MHTFVVMITYPRYNYIINIHCQLQDVYFVVAKHNRIILIQHLSYEGTQYFVAGGGSMTDYVGATSSAKTLWTGEGYSAFASALVTENELTITYIDVNNDVKYQYTLTNSRDNSQSRGSIVPSVSPSQGPIAIGPPDAAAKGKFSVLVVSGQLAVISLVLIALGFAYDSRWRNNLRRARKPKSLLSSYMSPDSPFNEFMAGNINNPPKPSSRMKAVSPKLFIPKEEPYETLISDTTPASPSRSYFDSKAKRGLISFPLSNRTITSPHQLTYSTQDLTSEDESIVSITSLRSLDGKVFENVSSARVEGHKRARTSFF